MTVALTFESGDYDSGFVFVLKQHMFCFVTVNASNVMCAR